MRRIPNLLAIVLLLISAPAFVSAQNETEQAKKIVPEITLKGEILEQKPPFSLIPQKMMTLRDITDTIRKAGGDEEVAGMILRIQQPMMSTAQLLEVRGALEDYKESGKPLWASADMYSLGTYVLACSADEITLPPIGDLMTTGLPVQMFFIKDLLAEFGIQAQVVNTGRFKNAFEPFTHDEMTEGTRIQMSALVDDIFGTLVEIVAEERNITQEEARDLLTLGPHTADAAFDKGYVDALVYPNELGERVKETLGGDAEIVTDYSAREKKKRKTPNLFELIMGGGAAKADDKNGKPKVALVYALGPIIDGSVEESNPFAAQEVVASDDFIELLNEVMEDNVKALVLRVDSPGGSAIASDRIWKRLEEIQAGGVPVVVSMGGVAASGGYYISAGADKIYATDTTITGSIGVIGGKFVLGRMFEKFGISVDDSLSVGPHTGLFNLTEEWDEQEKEILNQLLNQIYDTFTTRVADGRGMSQEHVKELGGGRVWSGLDAQENNLVDEVGTLHDAIAFARERGGVPEAELTVYPKEPTFFEMLEKIMGGEVSAAAIAMDYEVIFPVNSSVLKAIETVIPRQHLVKMLFLFGEMKKGNAQLMVMPETFEIKI